jgi:uncharacterized cupredoxin-like copper-binding protein
MNRALGWDIFLSFAVVLLAGCAGATANQQPTVLAVEAKEFGFSPATLAIAVGQPVQLTLTNTGTLEHDFSIIEFPTEGGPSTENEAMPGHEMGGMTEMPALHLAAVAGESGTVTFTPTKPGTYEFICTVSGHKEAGMTGTLIVQAP